MSFINEQLLYSNHENGQIKRYEDINYPGAPRTCEFNELKDGNNKGMPIVSRHIGDKLYVTTTQNTHALVIGSTRSGKTTSYIIPSIWSIANQKVKSSMLITDVKGELYRDCSQMLRDQGYDVKLLNFRDFRHSEFWNPLTSIYRIYIKINTLEDEVVPIIDGEDEYFSFMGKLYKNVEQLKATIDYEKKLILREVEKEIEILARQVCPTINNKDPYWDDSAREVFKGILWGLLEDTKKKGTDGKTLVTEDNFSFRSVFKVLSHIAFSGNNTSKEAGGDNGFFSDRPYESKAWQLVSGIIFNNASNTRNCVMSTLNTKIAPYREVASIEITSCNTLDLDVIADSEKPVAIFVVCRDEIKAAYNIVQLFVSSMYIKLINRANQNSTLRLDKPFYFILDEFGNFPKIEDFENTISACGGRNIWLTICLQSYAQLEHVYEKDVSEIIKDNLNMHIFFGTNNPETKELFSKECGKKTILSPLSVMNGSGERIDHFSNEQVSLVPVSKLNYFIPGECVITRTNCEYVLWSMMERSFLCSEFVCAKTNAADYETYADLIDDKYEYLCVVKNNNDY